MGERGRIARSVEAADAGLQASIEDYRDVLVVVYAEVAINYNELRALQDRIRLADQNIAAQAHRGSAGAQPEAARPGWRARTMPRGVAALSTSSGDNPAWLRCCNSSW